MDVRSPQQYCLRWNNHLPNLGSVFAALLQREVLVDVTLTSEGRSIKCHKVGIQAFFYLVTKRTCTLFGNCLKLQIANPQILRSILLSQIYKFIRGAIPQIANLQFLYMVNPQISLVLCREGFLFLPCNN
jgi:hypothetical protein